MNVVSALDAGRWSWDGERREDEHLGRACVALSGDGVAAVIGAELADGVVEADLALTGGRGFHGLVWRLRGLDYESFYVRPHQNGNPDAIQYTPGIFELTADESERLAGEVVEVLRRYSSGPPRHGAVRVGITFRALPVLGGDA